MAHLIEKFHIQRAYLGNPLCEYFPELYKNFKPIKGNYYSEEDDADITEWEVPGMDDVRYLCQELRKLTRGNFKRTITKQGNKIIVLWEESASARPESYYLGKWDRHDPSYYRY